MVRASRERRRHGGDPRRRAQQRSDRQSDCARYMKIPTCLDPRSRSRGGRSTAGSPARARCSAWEIGRSGRARSRKGQHAPHRAGRGEAQAKAFLRLRGGFDDCLSQTEPLTGFGLDQKQRLRHYCRLDPCWATVTRCEWGSSVFTVVYTEGAMAIIIRVALPSSFRAASYHGGSSQLLILLVSAVRGAVPLRRRRSGAVSYLQLLHAAPPLGELIGSNLLARFSRCLS